MPTATRPCRAAPRAGGSQRGARQGLGGGRGGSDRAAAGADLRVDVRGFRDALATVARHRHARSEACADCLAELSRAADLYKGDFLAGFTLPDTAEFDTWQTCQTETCGWSWPRRSKRWPRATPSMTNPPAVSRTPGAGWRSIRFASRRTAA